MSHGLGRHCGNTARRSAVRSTIPALISGTPAGKERGSPVRFDGLDGYAETGERSSGKRTAGDRGYNGCEIPLRIRNARLSVRWVRPVLVGSRASTELFRRLNLGRPADVLATHQAVRLVLHRFRSSRRRRNRIADAVAVTHVCALADDGLFLVILRSGHLGR